MNIKIEKLIEVDGFRVEIVQNEKGDFFNGVWSDVSDSSVSKDWFRIEKGMVQDFSEGSLKIKHWNCSREYCFYKHYHNFFKFVVVTKVFGLFRVENDLGIVDENQMNTFLNGLKRYC